MKRIQLTKLRWLLLCLTISVGAGNVWGQATTATLSNADIVAAGTAKTGYASWTITDGSSREWNAYAIKNQHSNATSSYHYLQIKKYASSTAYYVQVPTLGTKITSITMTVSSASQPMTGGGNSATLFFSSSNSTSATGTGVASGTGTSSVTIDCSSLNLNTGYITASAGVRIWDITVTYTTSSATATTTTFPQSSYSATYPGTFAAPTATVKAGSTTVTSPAVTYSSSNTSVATVNSSTGAVTLVGIGTTTITANYAGNSSYAASSASYTLTVTDGRTATSVSFPSNSYDAVVGEAFTAPAATLSPSAAGSVTYSSSDASVATVNETTGAVTIVAVGTAIITASYAGNSSYQPSSASYTLNVASQSGGGSYTWDLSKATYNTPTSTDQVVWTSDFATMTADKANASTNANNYLGGDSNNRTSSRFYKSSTLTIAPASGYKIKSIEFEATSTSYASALKGSTWTNASASVSNTTVTVTPTSGTSAVVATIGGTCGFTGVTVYYEPTSSTVPDAPSLTPSCTFWPATTESPKMTVTIAPTTTGSYVRYTTNGTDPTTTTGTLVTTSQNLTITATTTVKAIAYSGTATSGIATATYTLGQTVNSIAAFKELSVGTEARLYLSPEQNARVLHYNGSEIYLRDNSGAICLFLNSSLQKTIPAHDYHVAGWIIGKYQPYNNLPELVATSNTTTAYLAFAAPVTEEATEPVAISADDFDNYKADWVTITDLRAESNNNVTDDAGNTFKVYNKYGLNADSYYQDLYDYALVDLTGLAVPFGTDLQIVPIYYNNARPIVYVIDENKDFTSPGNDIRNVTVRLVRTLSASNWNTFAIPFDIPDFNGRVRKYEHAEGTTMMFADDSQIEAGKPYLVKPEESIINPVFTNVTLSATPAQNVGDGEEDGYSFNAIYSPTNIYSADRTNRFLKSDGYLYYPTDEDAGRLKGMRAYFVVPAGASNVKVNPDGTLTFIDDVQGTDSDGQGTIYDLSGRRVGNDLRSLPRGLYIVNGKKVYVQ